MIEMINGINSHIVAERFIWRDGGGGGLGYPKTGLDPKSTEKL